jgi:hypothetical protein
MTAPRFEHVILSEILRNPDYRNLLFDLQADYFGDLQERIICSCIMAHIERYSQPPTCEALVLAIDDAWPNANDEDRQECRELAQSLHADPPEPRSIDWLKCETEKFIRAEGFRACLSRCIALDDAGKHAEANAAVDEARKMRDYKIDDPPGLRLDWKPLYESLQALDEQFPFAIPKLDEMTCGGPTRQTLNIWQAATGTGKSLVMCHQSADNLREHRKVLYITLELGGKKVLHRIFANLLDTPYGTLADWTDKQWSAATETLNIPADRLRIRHYTSEAHAGDFTRYINQLKQREGFVPDVIFIDYLNECSSKRMKYSKGVGTYQYVGSVAGELRDIAIETNTVLWTATQTNRDGFDELGDLKNTSDSNQTNNKGDLIISINRIDGRDDSLLFTVLKTRDTEHNRTPFWLRVDRSKMRLYDSSETYEADQVMQVLKQKRKTNTPKFAKTSA